jgi:hypothetical protein
MNPLCVWCKYVLARAPELSPPHASTKLHSTTTSKPETRNPKPETLNRTTTSKPQLQTLNPKPKTDHDKQAPNPKPYPGPRQVACSIASMGADALNPKPLNPKP